MQLQKPLVAAIEGHAVAGGLELSLLADLRVADEHAVFGVFCRRFGIARLSHCPSLPVCIVRLLCSCPIWDYAHVRLRSLVNSRVPFLLRRRAASWHGHRASAASGGTRPRARPRAHWTPGGRTRGAPNGPRQPRRPCRHRCAAHWACDRVARSSYIRSLLSSNRIVFLFLILSPLAVGEAHKLALEIAKFPQICSRADRASVYYSTFDARSYKVCLFNSFNLTDGLV